MKKIGLQLIIVFAFSLGTFAQYGYNVNDVAEDFKLKNIDDKQISLADFTDAKGFIVVFTCNECPYAVLYEDRIIALDKKYKNQGYPVIAINPNDPEVQPGDSFKKMKVRAKEKGFTFPYLFDEGQKVYPKYGASRTPHVYFLNKEKGKYIVKYIGAIDDNAKHASEVEKHYLEEAIAAVMDGKEPVNSHTKAIGCSIKHK